MLYHSLFERTHVLPLIFRFYVDCPMSIKSQICQHQLKIYFSWIIRTPTLEPSLKFHKDYIRSSTLKCSMMHSKMNIPHAMWHTEHFLRLVPYHKFLVSRYPWYWSASYLEHCALSSNPSSFCSRWLVLTRN